MLKYKLNTIRGVSPPSLWPPDVIKSNRHQVIIAQRRGSRGEQARFPPSSYLSFFYFPILIKGISRAKKSTFFHPY